MGMAVFSGMLIATVLGVCLIPMLFVLIERLIGAGHASASSPATPRGGPLPTPSPAHGSGSE
jgi:hypothetical protein